MSPAFRIAGIQVVIPRKDVRDVPETAYKEPQWLMKTLIQDLQAHSEWVRSFHNDVDLPSSHQKKWNKAWTLDSERLLRNNSHLFVPKDEALREELISKCHNNPLAGYFGAAKTHELLAQKYHWDGSLKQVPKYCKLCDICQRTKAPRYWSYGKLTSLPVATKP